MIAGLKPKESGSRWLARVLRNVAGPVKTLGIAERSAMILDNVLYRIPDPLEMKGTSAAEGLAVDAMGNVYGAEVGPRQLVKHIK